MKRKLGNGVKLRLTWFAASVVIIGGLFMLTNTQQKEPLVQNSGKQKEVFKQQHDFAEIKAVDVAKSQPTIKNDVASKQAVFIAASTVSTSVIDDQDKVKKTGELTVIVNRNRDENEAEELKNTFYLQKRERLQKESGQKQNYQDAFKGLKSVELLAVVPELGKSMPELEKTRTKVDVNTVAAENKMHIGLSPWLMFWDNAAATGIYGNHQVSVMADQEWKSFQQLGQNIGFKWNQPLVGKIGYDRKINKTPFSVGTFMSHEVNENWTKGELNLSGAYQLSVQSNVLNIGVNANYMHNQLQTHGLLLKEEALSNGNHYVREQSLANLEVPSKQSLSFNIGLLWRSEHYFVAYNALNPVVLDLTRNSTKEIKHNGLVGVHLPIRKLKSTIMLKTEYSSAFEISPGVALSYNNHWFLSSEYEQLERFTFSVGRQFDNGFRAHISYGSVLKREVESNIRVIYSQKGHVGVGMSYIIK